MKRSHLSFVVCGLFVLAVAAHCKSGGDSNSNPGTGGASAGNGQGGDSSSMGGSVAGAGAGGSAVAGAGGGATAGAGGAAAGGAGGVPAACDPVPKLKLTLLTKSLIPAMWTNTGWNAAPLMVTQARGDERIFVAQRGGRILILRNGVLGPDPFLDITTSVSAPPWPDHGERGLINLALHPDYANNGRFFVYYTSSKVGTDIYNGDVVIAEGKRSAANPDKADPTLKPLLILEHSGDRPQRYDDGHNGGLLVFGKDGHLWTAVGDGGNGYDYFNTGQNPTHPLAKLYRLDVDNPPADPHNGANEIWAMGLRNPWRGSVDPDTGDLYIGDVQENHWEEIDWMPFGTDKGLNYGWGSLMKGATQGEAWVKAGMEALHCFPSYIKDCEKFGTLPIFEYPHKETGAMSSPRNHPELAETVTERTAQVAGFVYRGNKIPGMRGRFIWGDHGTNVIKSFINRNGTVDCLEDHTADLVNTQTPLRELIGFGRDADGELFIFDMDMAGAAKNSSIYRLEAE